MKQEHRDLQQWVKDRFASKYQVEAEIDGQIRLPDKERHWYQPDVVVRDSAGEIKYIIEVENDPMRKQLVGASILADASVKELNQKSKPKLIFVVYAEQGIKQMQNFKAKLEIAKQYCDYLEDVEIYSKDEFEELTL